MWFDARTDATTPAIDVGDEEAVDAQWFETPPAEAVEPVAERFRSRMPDGT